MQNDIKLLAQKMNTLLAEMYALYLKTQNYHWNVKGANFYNFHLLFEQQYKEQAEAVDELAEKIRSMGMNVQADLQYFASHSTISLPNKDFSATDMIKDLTESHTVIINPNNGLGSHQTTVHFNLRFGGFYRVSNESSHNMN